MKDLLGSVPKKPDMFYQLDLSNSFAEFQLVRDNDTLYKSYTDCCVGFSNLKFLEAHFEILLNTLAYAELNCGLGGIVFFLTKSRKVCDTETCRKGTM